MNTYDITITAKSVEEDLLGLKEAIAMDLEKYGDIEVVDVREED